MGNLLINSCRKVLSQSQRFELMVWLIFQRSRGGVGGAGGVYSNVNPYLGGLGYGGGNLPYRSAYGGYADIGNQDLTRRQFQIQQQQQQLGNYGLNAEISETVTKPEVLKLKFVKQSQNQWLSSSNQ